MYTHKDIECRTIFVINCLDRKNLRVHNGELLLEEITNEKATTLTKLPFQKILALFVIGNISITTPLIEKCKRFNIALVVMKPSLRPVFFWSNSAEANYLVRQKQYSFCNDDLSVAKGLVFNKIKNQLQLLSYTRCKDDETEKTKKELSSCIQQVADAPDYQTLMGIEGMASKSFFKCYFRELGWKKRQPRAKTDAINTTLDIGYTILFNFIECYLRMFGFDVYTGVYHRLWFKRKSLVCDLVEPFRCIIDRTVRTAFNRKQITTLDFRIKQNEYILKQEKNKDFCRLFFDALIPYKTEIFKYIQAYYRCFMRNAVSDAYPLFTI